ncbi:hypothetical protein CDAR_302731 [Caerostris darwini]|uniref:Uncharacterized protein n=1 Tax=Caerostris darwini TaxID=1538125 RepID=A0AAV4V4Y5_9ARAC|nr:hypothetical protein CDAR_302731 [Caerostris darwini]
MQLRLQTESGIALNYFSMPFPSNDFPPGPRFSAPPPTLMVGHLYRGSNSLCACSLAQSRPHIAAARWILRIPLASHPRGHPHLPINKLGFKRGKRARQ